MKKAIIIDGISILFMILFLYTGLSKLLEYSVFKAQLMESPILAPVSTIIAILLPVFEIVIMLLLLIPYVRLVGLYASLVLMIMFTIYVLMILVFDKKLPCSCGGIISAMSWPQHLLFNVVFVLMAVIGIGMEKKNKRMESFR